MKVLFLAISNLCICTFYVLTQYHPKVSPDGISILPLVRGGLCHRVKKTVLLYSVLMLLKLGCLVILNTDLKFSNKDIVLFH